MLPEDIYSVPQVLLVRRKMGALQLLERQGHFIPLGLARHEELLLLDYLLLALLARKAQPCGDFCLGLVLRHTHVDGRCSVRGTRTWSGDGRKLALLVSLPKFRSHLRSLHARPVRLRPSYSGCCPLAHFEAAHLRVQMQSE